MSIITFVIGIKTLFNKKTSDKVEQDKTIGNNTTEQTGENTNAETKKGQENLKDEVKSDVSESQDKETKEETRKSLLIVLIITCLNLYDGFQPVQLLNER